MLIKWNSCFIVLSTVVSGSVRNELVQLCPVSVELYPVMHSYCAPCADQTVSLLLGHASSGLPPPVTPQGRHPPIELPLGLVHDPTEHIARPRALLDADLGKHGVHVRVGDLLVVDLELLKPPGEAIEAQVGQQADV